MDKVNYRVISSTLKGNGSKICLMVRADKFTANIPTTKEISFKASNKDWVYTIGMLSNIIQAILPTI